MNKIDSTRFDVHCTHRKPTIQTDLPYNVRIFFSLFQYSKIFSSKYFINKRMVWYNVTVVGLIFIRHLILLSFSETISLIINCCNKVDYIGVSSAYMCPFSNNSLWQ